jgi:hypothetical protein
VRVNGEACQRAGGARQLVLATYSQNTKTTTTKAATIGIDFALDPLSTPEGVKLHVSDSQLVCDIPAPPGVIIIVR